ncbi:hypothetical protein [Stigmatella aurantiaca]|uniref:hypothetical protein n=1 Tax=Stigmatella aurantiaca TaxID=41 RepID=UPI0018DBD04C|nr:hypothetical protein [Stigmatella aurantiaca]
MRARSETLLPATEASRARAITWVLAALNSIEILIQQLAEIDLFHEGEAWAKLRRPGVEEAVKHRLAELVAWLGNREYLEGSFTAGDLMMTTVLRVLRHTEAAGLSHRVRGQRVAASITEWLTIPPPGPCRVGAGSDGNT